LTDWYLDLKKAKTLASYPTLKILLSQFNSEFRSKVLGKIKLEDLENYQVKRKKKEGQTRPLTMRLESQRPLSTRRSIMTKWMETP
jgi:hypothetical protein